MRKGLMVSLCLKNKRSAVRFCLWPQGFLPIMLKIVTKTIIKAFSGEHAMPLQPFTIEK